MNRLAAAALLATTLLAGVAHAAVDPTPGKEDPRIRGTPYDPKQVLRATSTGLVPLQFIYEAGEKPILIAGRLVFTDADKAKDWYAHAAENVLILQPMHHMQPSFLFVQTVTATGEQRHYNYELATRDGDPTNAADLGAYVEVDYTYKHTPTPEEIAAWRARRDAREAAAAERAASVRLAEAAYATPRNLHYDKRGADCAALAPLQVSDNNQQTTLLFAAHAELPNIYQIGLNDKPSILNPVPESTPEGTLVTLPSTYRQLRLMRAGRACDLRNNAFDPVGAPPGGGTGTTSPDVVRQARSP